MSQDFRDRCSTYQIGRCDGTKRTICGACGGPGHGNCDGGGDWPIQIPCEGHCPGRTDAIEEAEREIVTAAQAWVEDDSWKNRTALRAAVEKLAKVKEL